MKQVRIIISQKETKYSRNGEGKEV